LAFRFSLTVWLPLHSLLLTAWRVQLSYSRQAYLHCLIDSDRLHAEHQVSKRFRMQPLVLRQRTIWCVVPKSLRILLLPPSSAVKMETGCYSKMPTITYQNTQCRNPQTKAQTPTSLSSQSQLNDNVSITARQKHVCTYIF
jgi:hypothetical protein